MGEKIVIWARDQSQAERLLELLEKRFGVSAEVVLSSLCG